MLTAELSEILNEIHVGIRVVNAACVERGEGWRYQIVQVRRQIGDALRRMSTLTGAASASPALTTFRGALSRLRSVVAELQAAWPVVTLDPSSSEYQFAIQRVRASLETLETTLEALRREPASIPINSAAVPRAFA